MNTKRILLASAALTLATALSPTAAQANLLVNGSFETGTLAGWSSSEGSLNPFGTTYGAGMDGTYWAWLAGYERPVTMTQTVSGLTVGKIYTLKFIQASEYSSMDRVRVSVNGGAGTLFTSPSYISGGPGNGFWNVWVQQTYTFKALSSTNTIQFDTVGINQGGYDVGIDKIDLTTGTVPEPATWSMLITGFGLVGLAARRRKTAVAA